jgi:uncharacterized protein (DUF1501 family)
VTLSRREFVVGLGAATGIRFLAPIVVRAGAGLGEAVADPASAARRRLVVIFLQGGNDGLNTVIPTDDVAGAARYSVYKKVRPSISYDRGAALPLNLTSDDTARAMGLNPKLQTMHKLYTQSRMAVVQGVDYPKHSYSHFESTDVWQSGMPGNTNDSGWVGRHLDRAGIADGEIRGLGIGTELPLILRGQQRQGVEVQTIPSTKFMDGRDAVGTSRHQAFARFSRHPLEEPLRHFVGQQAENTVSLVDHLAQVPAPPATSNGLAYAMLTARTLLEQNLGVECVFVTQAGYDTHAAERQQHENLLTQLDQAIEVFFFGTIGGAPLQGAGPMSPQLAAQTLVMTTSEFGRRIGENGSGQVAGTDHGAAGPLFLIGPAPGANKVGLVPGLHEDHPAMGSPTLPADNLVMTTELRRVYQAVLQSWLTNPDPGYDKKYAALPGLFR